MGATPIRHSRLNSPQAARTARDYAQQLLDSIAVSFGVRPERPLDLADEHPALTWANSGLMTLTGLRDGEPLMCPLPLAACADGALAALASFTPLGAFAGMKGSQLMGERAAVAGLSRAGFVSPGGACRLLEAADGWVAVNLARPDDWELVPAWLECELEPGWEPVTRMAQCKPVAELLERGRVLGLAVAAYELPAADTLFPSPLVGEGWGEGAKCLSVIPPPPTPSREGRGDRKTILPRVAGRPIVIDLSSLWAGPLCSHLLQKLGADVIKVESVQRPDGARQGPQQFFELLNAGKRNVLLDFSTAQGVTHLRELIADADIVIEGSRPRGLRQLGIHAEALIEANPQLTWVGISGYGRGEPEENWVAYGDDAAVSAGLSWIQYQATGQHMIVGDAIADPLTGLHAALAAWVSWRSGGGRLISLALRDIVANCIHFDLPQSLDALLARQAEWMLLAWPEIAPPTVRLADSLTTARQG